MSICNCLSAQNDYSDYARVPMSPSYPGNTLDHELLIQLPDSDAINVGLLPDALRVVGRSHGLAASTLKINKAASSSIQNIPYLQILSATISRPSPTASEVEIVISAIVIKADKRYKLWKIEGKVHDEPVVSNHVTETENFRSLSKAEIFCQELERRAYKNVKPRRRLRVIINPIGGKGKAKQIYKENLIPIFRAAGCTTSIEYTGAPDTPTDARELARLHPYEKFDAIVAVSGDGIVHQLINGLAGREDGLLALRSTCISAIPAGSGNAISINLYGPQRGDDPIWASLGAIKGESVALDLCSVTQSGQTSFSFLSQAVGLMADIDLGTENLRWMGDTRFLVGYIRGSLAKREYPVKIELNVVGTTDKVEMAKAHNRSLKSSHSSRDQTVHQEGEDREGKISLEFGDETSILPEQSREIDRIHRDWPQRLSEGWHTIEAPIFFGYGGKLPFVAKDTKMFPLAKLNDGLIDLTISPPQTRMAALSGMDGAETGKLMFNEGFRYYKVSAYRISLLNTNGHIAIDGESVAHKPFQVECHKGLARLLAIGGKLFEEPVQIPEGFVQ